MKKIPTFFAPFVFLISIICMWLVKTNLGRIILGIIALILSEAMIAKTKEPAFFICRWVCLMYIIIYTSVLIISALYNEVKRKG